MVDRGVQLQQIIQNIVMPIARSDRDPIATIEIRHGWIVTPNDQGFNLWQIAALERGQHFRIPANHGLCLNLWCGQRGDQRCQGQQQGKGKMLVLHRVNLLCGVLVPRAGMRWPGS